MLETNPKISYIRIVYSHIEIARTLSKNFELKVGCKAKIKTPKNVEDKNAILNMELNIATTEKDDMKIELEADVLFEFNQVPDDYDKVMEEECMPMAQTKLFNMLDDILVDMGYQRLGLAEKD